MRRERVLRPEWVIFLTGYASARRGFEKLFIPAFDGVQIVTIFGKID